MIERICFLNFIINIQFNIQPKTIIGMAAWLMFKDSGSYNPRGKKCDGLINKAKPSINLSWGMDTLDTVKAQSIKLPAPSPSNKIAPSALYEKKSEQQQLEKIMKKYNNRKQFNNKPIKLMNDQDDLNYFNSKSATNRTDTQQSRQKIRFLENSLLPSQAIQPIYRRDTMGSILNYEKAAELDMSQSRVSRRSVSGNKKNQSRVVFGDGYNSFVDKADKQKDYHQKLMEMYKYEEQRNNRKVSQCYI